MTFSGAVLGSPIQHSLSPVLYRAAFAYLRLDDATFDAVELGEEDAIRYWQGLDSPERRGFAVTMPLKEQAACFADDVTSAVRATGAANTLVFRDGLWRADNTDIAGIAAVAEEHVHYNAAGERTRVWWVLGSGATARSAVAAAALSGVHRVVVISRRQPDLEVFGRCARLAACDSGGSPLVSYRRFDELCHQRDGREPDRLPEFVVSTVPANASATILASPWWQTLRAPDPRVPVLDVAYNPWPSALARDNYAVVSGVEMLIHQAAHQMKFLLGRDVPVAVLREAVASRD